jgi:hypothetical protein
MAVNYRFIWFFASSGSVVDLIFVSPAAARSSSGDVRNEKRRLIIFRRPRIWIKSDQIRALCAVTRCENEIRQHFPLLAYLFTSIREPLVGHKLVVCDVTSAPSAPRDFFDAYARTQSSSNKRPRWLAEKLRYRF